MIGKKMEKALNEQLNAELYSWYLYLSMSAHFEEHNFTGISKWMKIQAHEEYTHAMKFYDYIIQVGKIVSLEAISAPKRDWSSHLEVFEQVFEHEMKITEQINNLMNLAVEEKDHASNSFLLWFVNEQVEEVATAKIILEKAKFIGDSHNGLFMLDHEMGKRQ
ncbi:MAG: ferritin [Methanococcaceae archaeon]